MAEHNLLGDEGEKIAIQYLKSKNYLIHHSNWRMGQLEVDIIADNGEEVVFVEVKTRSSDEFGAPEESVDEQKEKDLITVADVYLERLNIEVPVRFDIIAIVLNEDSSCLTHYEDAFSGILNFY